MAAQSGLLSGLDPAFTFLVLLIAGHVLGDFLLQTRRLAEAKDRRFRALAGHVGLVVLAHAVAIVPFFRWQVAVGLLGLGLAHGLTDGLKARWTSRRGEGLTVFVVDQAAHVVAVIITWLVLQQVSVGPESRPLPVSPPFGDEWLAVWVVGTVLLAAFAFTATGGSVIVERTLASLNADLDKTEVTAGVQGSGRLIGILERMLTLILILLGQWAAMVLLLTAKSIARFEELKKRSFAEYYLIGTLTSLLVAVIVGLGLSLLLGP